jgi:serine/threonine-protein kinase
MRQEAPLAGVSAPVPEAVRTQLERILASRTFRRSRGQQRFLRHVVDITLEGCPEKLKETALGMEVFERGADFDPRIDTIVRVEARRLRLRLEAYYKNEGGNDDVLIALPPGGYVPEFFQRTAQPVRRRMGRRWIVAAIVLAVLAGAAVFWPGWRPPVSVAVLPFTDDSPGEGNQYRAEGVTEDIAQALAQVPRLKVADHAAAVSVRASRKSLAEIGRLLRVATVLEGSVQTQAGHHRVSARLVRVRDGQAIWSGTEAAGDAATLQNASHAIACNVARALHAEAPGAPGHIPPAEAQDLLLQARFLDSRGGIVNQQRAVELYEEAIQRDQGYARALGELARLLSLMAFHDSATAPIVAPRIKSAAARAIQLDPSLPNPYLALARLAWFYEWNWEAADRNWRRALEIAPDSAGLHESYALGLASRRRFREALEHSRRAAELDPLSFAASNDMGIVLYCSRRFEEAAAQSQRSLALAPDSLLPRYLLGVVRSQQNRPVEAIAELERFAARYGRPADVLGRLGYAYGRAGRYAAAQATLAELNRLPNPDAIYQAMLHTGLGQSDAALADLERSAGRHEPDLVFIGVEPAFDALRSEPRFAAICAGLGLAAR